MSPPIMPAYVFHGEGGCVSEGSEWDPAVCSLDKNGNTNSYETVFDGLQGCEEACDAATFPCMAFTYKINSNGGGDHCFLWSNGINDVPSMKSPLPWESQYTEPAGCWVRTSGTLPVTGWAQNLGGYPLDNPPPPPPPPKTNLPTLGLFHSHFDGRAYTFADSNRR